MQKQISIHSLQELEKFAEQFCKTIKLGDIILLSGPLGAGKTMFVQALGKYLGITEPITSPTYVYIHTYSVPRFNKNPALLAHIDLYRIENEHVFHSIGTMEYIGNPHVINIIEWGDQFAHFFPYISSKIEFIPVSETSRTLVIHTFNRQQ
ncbi:MAG TPA: tRNA (adenosine(37)-N6)-threonylcarbamoyltransferase complex ATPase subunit type 1 TsaE [Patescibacteria group bacterium]|nr:tRNA (adenosine(37)-N6)-threonylcarbamoyltransferase complex ATPase subunit type 1 TsaE [Patescibacteria group bacterium]